MSRNAVAAKKAKNKLKLDQLDPKIAEGITQGYSRKDVLKGKLDKEQPVMPLRPLHERVGHMREEHKSRDPRVRFVAEPNGAIVNFPDGRRFQDCDVTVTDEYKREMQAGYRCLRCHERHETSFPLRCEVCGYPMKERQILDVAMEFEGTKHIGPKKPIGEYIEEQDMRVEKREFLRSVLQGGGGWATAQKMVRQEPILLEGFTPGEQLALRG